jgi:hypothetical protein
VGPVPLPRQRLNSNSQMYSPTPVMDSNLSHPNNEQTLNARNLHQPKVQDHSPNHHGRSGVYNVTQEPYINPSSDQTYHQHHHSDHHQHHHQKKHRDRIHSSSGGTNGGSNVDLEDDILNSVAYKKNKREIETHRPNKSNKTETVLITLEITFIVLFALFVVYEKDQLEPEKIKKKSNNPSDGNKSRPSGSGGYPYPATAEEELEERPKQLFPDYYYCKYYVCLQMYL